MVKNMVEYKQRIKIAIIISISILTAISALIFIISGEESRDGIAIEFTTRVLDNNNSALEENHQNNLSAGKEALLIFRLKNNKTGEPISGLTPEISFYVPGEDDDSEHRHLDDCDRELNLAKLQLFVLNSERGTIEVLDTFGSHDSRPRPIQNMGLMTSKLIALRGSPGQKIGDMVAGRYGDFLYATVPNENQVAVVNTISHEVIKYIDVDAMPGLMFLQPRSRYLWVSNEGGSSVSIIDTENNTLVKTIATGKGYHEIAFSQENAYVTNNQSDTVSVIRLNDLTKTGYTRVDGEPYGIDYSNASNEVYVTNRHSGTVTVIDPKTHNIKKLIQLSPGIETIRFSPDGRRGVVLNRYEDSAYIIDAETGSLIKTVKTGEAPDSVVFMEEYALIRNTYSNDVTYISMIDPEISNNELVGGQPPFYGKKHSIITNPYGDEAVITSPGDNRIYFMHKMYGQPMVMTSAAVDYGSDTAAIVENKIHETVPGTYQQYIKLDRDGAYDIVFRTQRINATFRIDVLPDQMTGLKTTALFNRTFIPGSTSVLQYRIADRRTGLPEENLTDLIFIIIKPSTGKGTWTKRFSSKYIGSGIYEAEVTLPEEGIYMVTLASGALGNRGYDTAYDYITVRNTTI
ncbi:hypothetical protein ANME2D_00648 [Candidatus Methanoperedens nitroreducens]|uniref:YNCE-like beta-propeller domain-containing protein n=2 Tax=Candidatus Methanoperedens nitratireducens TaxID=1392998 RepID=A0A062V8F7_9EURY|nr:hypothetical protein ANME2D_00648 [Candidatus Methanoperedens nitroreducens]